jgi:hypothetical protein
MESKTYCLFIIEIYRKARRGLEPTITKFAILYISQLCYPAGVNFKEISEFDVHLLGKQ